MFAGIERRFTIVEKHHANEDDLPCPTKELGPRPGDAKYTTGIVQVLYY